MALCASMPVAVGADPARFYTASTLSCAWECLLLGNNSDTSHTRLHRAVSRSDRMTGLVDVTEDSPSTFYMDESGQGGDLATAGPSLDFRNQPVFVLAAVGCDAEADLAEGFESIRVRRFPQAMELKSASGHASPSVIGDLLDLLERVEAKILMEVMDKRFTLAATMTNTLVMRPVGPSDREPKAYWLRAQLAECLHDAAPTAVYDAFLDACRQPSEATIKAAFRAILVWIPPSTSRDTIMGALRFITLDSLKDFRKEGPRRPEVQRRFLPLSDPGHTGKPVWVLPHLSAFTSLYARINRLRNSRLHGVRILHDEQRYYADILASAKAAAEGLAEDGEEIVFERADYRLGETGDLAFVPSDGLVGIQAADLLAGFAMRHVRDALAGVPPSSQAVAAFRRIADGRQAHRGVGMNLMLSNRDVWRCGLVPSRDPAMCPH